MIFVENCYKFNIASEECFNKSISAKLLPQSFFIPPTFLGSASRKNRKHSVEFQWQANKIVCNQSLRMIHSHSPQSPWLNSRLLSFIDSPQFVSQKNIFSLLLSLGNFIKSLLCFDAFLVLITPSTRHLIVNRWWGNSSSRSSLSIHQWPRTWSST